MAIIEGIPQFQIHPILVPGMRHERHIDSLGEWSAHGEKKNPTSHVRQKQMRFSFHESVGVYPMINHAMKTINGDSQALMNPYWGWFMALGLPHETTSHPPSHRLCKSERFHPWPLNEMGLALDLQLDGCFTKRRNIYFWGHISVQCGAPQWCLMVYKPH